MTASPLGHLSAAWCESFRISESGDNRWVVSTPLIHEDGDALPIFVELNAGGWELTDLGMSCSHLFFDGFEYTEGRFEAIRRAVEGAGAALGEGHRVSLELEGPPSLNDLGDFLQIVAQVQGVARSQMAGPGETQFRKAMRKAVEAHLDAGDFEAGWAPPLSGRASYKVDLKLVADHRPVALFLASTSARVRHSALAVDQLRKAHVDVTPMLAYRSGPGITDDALAAFLDYAEEAGGGDDSAVEVEPGHTFPLTRRLERLGVPIH